MTSWLRSSFVRSALTAALACLSVSAAAQSGERFRVNQLGKPQVRGMSATEAQALSSRVQRLVDILQAQPQLGRPTAPHCVFLYSSIESSVYPDTGLAGASIAIGFPQQSSRDGTCAKVPPDSITVRINDVSKVYSCLDPIGGLERCHVPAFSPGPAGFLEHRGAKSIVYLLVPPGQSLVVPLTKEHYLRAYESEWLQQLEKMGASDTPPGSPEQELERWLREEKPKLVALNEQALKGMAPYMTPAEYEKAKCEMMQSVEDQERIKRQELAALRGASGPDPRLLSEDQRLRQNLADLRKRLASMTPSELAAPACIEDRNANPTAPFWSAGDVCLPQSELGSPNPRLLGRVAPSHGAIRSICISATSGATVGVLPYIHQSKLEALNGMDFAAKAAVARP
jgi:hypothetical protein